MKNFMNDDFLLNSVTAVTLYNEYARDLPIIDYHNHLPPEEIAADRRYANLTEVWLNGDHYKWRAMRANGIDERFITGNATDREKFAAWAATVPYTWRNPLFHWTHLELKRYFGIDALLQASTADEIFDRTQALLQQPGYTARGLLERMKVQTLCTTDDPVDDLRWHKQIREEGWAVKVLPAFRPDKAMQVDDVAGFHAYLGALEACSNTAIGTYPDYLHALRKRHDHFVAHGSRISDHGLEEIYADDHTEREVADIFLRIRNGRELTLQERRKFKSAMLVTFAEWDWEKGFVQQYHLGPIRNNNSRALRTLGPDTGWDSTGDLPQAKALSTFLDRLDRNNTLARTILYNINPADNEVFATMTGNFNDGTVAGKIQWGSAWWFLDQKDGIVKHLNTLSQMGLLSRFVGMLTDSRSFLSFPRHEYFRRILCDLIATDIENGELPHDIPWAGKIIGDICYHNAVNYFDFKHD